MNKIFWFGLLIAMITTVVITNPPGVRCQYQQECVPIQLF